MIGETVSAATVELVEARLAVYRFLLEALAKPTAEQHAWFAGPVFRHRSLKRPSSLAPHRRVSLPPTARQNTRPATSPASRSAYRRRRWSCWQATTTAAKPATAVIHEHILFYRRFGAALSAGNIEPADHLLNELAFLIRLDELYLGGEPGASILRARRDFLRRQAARWPARAAEAAAEQGLPAVYRSLFHLLAAAVAQDLELTDAALRELGGDES